MNTLSPIMEQAYMSDERVRMRQVIENDKKRTFWRKVVIDMEEISLEDYERPVKIGVDFEFIGRKKRSVLSTIKLFLKNLIP